MNEVGPHFDLKFRRNQIASGDLFKTACKKPKVLNPEKKKVINILNKDGQKLICFFRPIKMFIQQISEIGKQRFLSNNKMLKA
jgi:hypothetical protein